MRSAIRVGYLLLCTAILWGVIQGAYSTASASASTTAIRKWLYSEPVVRCFPQLTGPNFYVDRFNPHVLALPPLPNNPIPLRFFGLLPRGRDIPNAVIDATGRDADIHERAAAFDPALHEVALNDQYYELADFVLLGHVNKVPAVIPRRALRIRIGGLPIGAQEADVERLFGYSSSGAVKRVTRCGFTAEQFQSVGNGAGVGFLFVFEGGNLVAYSAGGGS